ncbi:MAG: hypothetical protein ABL921_30955, partial [Pirellula sp.]
MSTHMDGLIVEKVIVPSSRPLNEAAQEFLRDARHRMKSVRCFDFVPSNYEKAWQVLDSLDRGTLCEWGSGLGVVVGLAEILGFEATGIEIDGELAELARELLTDHGLTSTIRNGNYLESFEQFQ